MANLEQALRKLANPSGEAIANTIATVRPTYEQIFLLARSSKGRFRESLSRAFIQMPFSKAKKGNGVPVPYDRWYILVVANDLMVALLDKRPREALAIAAPFEKYLHDYVFLARNFAAAHAQLGNAAAAVKYLKVLADRSFEYMIQMETEPAFKRIHGDAKYKAFFKAWNRSGTLKDSYEVEAEKWFPKSFSVPPLLRDFYALARRIKYGSIGYFTLGGSSNRYIKSSPIAAAADDLVAFLTLGEGTDLAFWRHGTTWDAHPPIVQLGSEGENELVAHSLEEFLTKIGTRRTGIDDIDEKYADEPSDVADMRPDLKQWLAKRKVRVPKAGKLPNFDRWLAAKLETKPRSAAKRR